MIDRTHLTHVFLLCLSIFLLDGCDHSSPTTQPTTAPTTQPRIAPTIASLVPAATDLLIGMHAADHLVAVSNFETDRPAIHDLPRVGDYQTTDWEKVSQVKPNVMVTYMSRRMTPMGVFDHARALNINMVNIETDRLDDIYDAIEYLGTLSNEPAKAAALTASLKDQLKAVQTRVANQPRVRTLLALDDQNIAMIADDTFMDDLLTIAGGENVAANSERRYPTIDDEKLAQLAPQAIIQLMPNASPQVVERARQMWMSHSKLPAVVNGRVWIFTDWYALQPGSHIGELAEKFADKLHPIH